MSNSSVSSDYIDKGFLGHPIGLRTLFLTEMWERMSFYGMRGLLVLFMTAGIFNGGFAISQSEANTIVAIYVGMVYFMCFPSKRSAIQPPGKHMK
jgi:POT family proton-dependent oligopeptide transporter